MRTFTVFCSALLMGALSTKAQTVATFEDLTLPHADTFYVNYSASGSDVGVDDGLGHFPCVYDTSWGGFWSYGFAYSNMTDSVTSGYMNQYSAKTAKGYAASNDYMVCYGVQNTMKLIGAAIGHPVSGFYVANSTYAYNSMRDGDPFARKFHNGDWFKLTVRGYSGGTLKPDSVGVYLADFLFPDTTMNYILKTWQWVNVMPLGNVDSLQFTLTSTDNGSFGMNTPAYFCIDNFTTNESTTGVSMPKMAAARVYPNPALDVLYVDVLDRDIQQIAIQDAAGNTVGSYSATNGHIEINTTNLPAGMYMLQMTGNGRRATAKFVKN